METTPDQRPAISALPTSIRSMGAMLGAFLGLGAMALLYLASTMPVVESVLHTRFILGPDGMAATSGTRLLAWVVAPIAAASAGWISAPRALVGRRLAGVRMGYWTYAIAIVIAPVLVLGPQLVGAAGMDRFERQPFDSLVSLVTEGPVALAMYIGFGSVILAPLLVICAGAGVVWASAVRWVARGRGDSGPRPAIPETDARLLAVIAVILGLTWLLFAALILGLPFVGGDFVD